CALVTNWSNDTSSDEQTSNNNLLRSPFSGSNWMSSSGGGGNSNGSIPLTRARQVRRLHNLVNLIAEIRASGVPADYSGELVQAFVSCHSPAEVYRNADIEAVFGPVSDHSAKVAALLAERMRSSLSGQWQRMEIQTQNNTNRTPEDQIAEVRRGYALALELLDRALKRNPDDADLHLALAATTFDQAEFLHGQMVDLKTYVAMRDKAFKHYADTAALYAASPAPTTPGRQRADIYARWFSAALGASDLSSLLPSDTPHADQIDQIAAALRGLGGEAASAHIKQFAEAFLQSSREVPAQLKPFCCRQVLRVVRDHPAGDPIRKLLRTYDELIAEVEFSAELDGAADVGTNHPFGVRLAIRATSNMQREANGFIQVLAGNQGNSLDPKEKIKSMLKEQLADRFDIDVVQFHDPTTAPRSFGRQGWLEKPVAYLVLRAKNPAVDRLPPLHVDLEFGDGSGTVLLPIASPPLLVSAAKEPKRGEVSAVKLRQIFDDRTARDGSWQVEVKATATGLVTDLDQVLVIKPDMISGAKVSKIDRGAISVSGFDLTGKQIRPISQRTWTIYLTPKGESATTPFQFPAAAVAGSEMKYQRYEDFDVVDAGATVTARTGRDGAGWLHGGALWATLGGFVIVLAGLLVWLKRRSKPSAVSVAAYRRPAAPSPFNVLDLLRRIRTDASLKLSEDERSALDQAVIQLETRYFSRPNGDGGDLPLGEMLNRWLARATSNGH
ncbi:MAG: hypothetical protein K8T25_20245, partial [Planctomycetia bacterium]|nr:hypothetical protein [Planctomycetia bacterium]